MLDLLRSTRGPVDREGCGVPQNRGNGLVLECYGQNGSPIHREGCGVLQNGTPRAILHLHRRPPPASTGYCSSTVDLLQPPPTTVHPRAPVHPASTACSSTGYCSTSPLHGILFNHPSTGYCSSSPPAATVQPALHRLLFNHPSTGSCSSSPPRGPVHPPPTSSIDRGLVHLAATPRGPVHPTTHRELFIQTPQQRSLFI